jgi:hypothetical protein
LTDAGDATNFGAGESCAPPDPFGQLPGTNLRRRFPEPRTAPTVDLRLYRIARSNTPGVIMKRRIFLALGLVAATAACEQDPQQLPFGPVDAAVTVPVGASGGSVTSAKGASVTFPPQSLPGNVTVTVTPTSTPTGVQASGTPVSNGSFAIGPHTTALNAPVTVDMKMTAAHQASASAWLTSLVVHYPVNGGVVIPYGLGHVDLATGIVSTEVDYLGTMTLVNPGAGSVVMMQRQTGNPAGATLVPAAVGASALVPTVIYGRCAVTPCAPDAMPSVSLIAAAGALPSYAEGAVIFWRFAGGFDVHSPASVTGQIDADFPVRIRMSPSRPGSYAPVVTVPFRVRLQPTGGTAVISTTGSVTLTNVSITMMWDGGSSTMIQDLVIDRTATGGNVVLQRTFTFDGQPIGIRAVVPVNLD